MAPTAGQTPCPNCGEYKICPNEVTELLKAEEYGICQRALDDLQSVSAMLHEINRKVLSFLNICMSNKTRQNERLHLIFLFYRELVTRMDSKVLAYVDYRYAPESKNIYIVVFHHHDTYCNFDFICDHVSL